MKKTKKVIGLLLAVSLLVLNFQVAFADIVDLVQGGMPVALLDAGTSNQQTMNVAPDGTFTVRARVLLDGGQSISVGPYQYIIKYDSSKFELVNSLGVAILTGTSGSAVVPAFDPRYNDVYEVDLNPAVTYHIDGEVALALKSKTTADTTWDTSEAGVTLYNFANVYFKVKSGVTTGTGTIYVDERTNGFQDEGEMYFDWSATALPYTKVDVTVVPADVDVTVSSVTPATAYGVAYNTSKATLDAGLLSNRATVSVTGSDTLTYNVPVVWDTTSYDPTNVNPQTITGKLTVASLATQGLTSATDVPTSITVNVAKDTVVSPVTVPTMEVAYGGELGAFPLSIAVTTANHIDGITANLGTFSPKEGQTVVNTSPGNYVYEASITSLSGTDKNKVEVPTFKAEITIHVNTQIIYDIATLTPSVSGIAVNYGTIESDVIALLNTSYPTIPYTTAPEGGSGNVAVTWTCASYNEKAPNTYTFTGTPKLTDTLTNSKIQTTSVIVTVKKLLISSQAADGTFIVKYGLDEAGLIAALPKTYPIVYGSETFTGTVTSWDFTGFDYKATTSASKNVTAVVDFSADSDKVTSEIPTTIIITQAVSVGAGITGITGAVNNSYQLQNTTLNLVATWTHTVGTVTWTSSDPINAPVDANGVVSIGTDANITAPVIIRATNSDNTANYAEITFTVTSSTENSYILVMDSGSFISDPGRNISLSISFTKNETSASFTGDKWLVANIIASDGAPIGVQAIRIPNGIDSFDTTLKYSNFPIGCYMDHVQIYDKFGESAGSGIILSNKIGKSWQVQD